MKIRHGFVSNSSSSSFIIGVKTKQDLSEAALVDALGVPETSALSDFAKELAQFIVNHAEEVTVEDMLYNYGIDTLDEAIEEDIVQAKLLKTGYKVYSLEASYNEYESLMEAFIGNGGLDSVETDAIVFKTQH